MEYHTHLSEHGYSFIPSAYYTALLEINDPLAVTENGDLRRLRAGYSDLKIDPYSPGNRYRSYVQCRVATAGQLLFGHFVDYQQTAEYNPDTGGIIRRYPAIDTQVLQNPLFQRIIRDDIRFVGRYGEIGAPDQAIIGIHLFRYRATVDAPAFSSPVWLHKDDEDVVFVHLIDSSDNILGGDNLIASSAKHIERVLRLESVFDTLVVNHEKLHAVTPVGCKPARGADCSTRDIILVTFQKEKDLS